MQHHRLSILLATAAFAVASIPNAFAQQQGPGWFVPGGQTAPAARQQAQGPARPAVRQAPRQSQPLQDQQGQPAIQAPLSPDGQLSGEPPLPQVPLPPVPELPQLPRGTSPPAAVIGVLGVPEIMHAASAAVQVEKIIGERREKLNEDAQKEQTAWRDLQQALAAQRATLSADQVRIKERELQDRITNAQKTFRDRNRIIQEAAQYSLGQIERTLIGVIRQVSESRGMNLVLHRSQVALNVNEFDITDQVVEGINKVMPTVLIPPDGVSPAAFAAAQPKPVPSQAAAAPAAAPVSGPAPVAAPAQPQAQPASVPASPTVRPATGRR